VLAGAYEGLVGWRYLLRRRRRPQVLLIGLGVLALGVGLTLLGVWLQQRQGGQVSVFDTRSGLPRSIMAAGGGLATFGGCLSLFGAFNTVLTVFSAFSAFMVTIGVAEVILVLGVMNGFQGDLRKKIIDTYAHVVIEPAKTGAYIEDYGAVAATARGVEGVVGATPTLSTEVMLSAPSNLAPVVLIGIEPATVGQANKLPDQLERGCFEALSNPDARCRHVLLRIIWSLTPRGQAEAEMAALVEQAEDAPPPREDDAAEPGADLMAPMPAPKQGATTAPPGLLLGNEVRKNLALWPGEVLNVVSPLGDLGPTGPVPKSRPFRVAGWFQSGMLEFDTRLGYADLQAVQHFMGLGDVADAVQVRTTNLEAARGARDALRAALPDTLRVTDWQERNRNLFSALKLEKIAMFLVLTINILLAAFSITSTLVMTIIERKREVAILMAMGSSSRGILRIFMSQGAFTGALGSLVGATLGVTGGLWLATLDLPLNQDVYYITAIPVDVRAADVVAIIVVAMLVSLVSTIYPALYASRLRPVEGLSSE
jgi:lipoprotein-releasing system permease protein